MKTIIRKFLWKLLGYNYFVYLHGQNKKYIDKAKNVTIGYKTYHNGAFVWYWDKNASLTIGRYCSIANDVNFILDDGFHQQGDITNFPHFNHILYDPLKKSNELIEFKNNLKAVKSDIKIGNDVWIGMNSIILPGVTVGDGVTIMAGSIVTKNVPDYALVGGVPATIVKMKHAQNIILSLKKIAWWYWENQKVEENWKDFYLPTESFIKKWNK